MTVHTAAHASAPVFRTKTVSTSGASKIYSSDSQYRHRFNSIHQQVGRFSRPTNNRIPYAYDLPLARDPPQPEFGLYNTSEHHRHDRNNSRWSWSMLDSSNQ